MSDELRKSLEFIKAVGDRAIQRGNIFYNSEEVITFVNAYNSILKMALEQDKKNVSNGIAETV